MVEFDDLPEEEKKLIRDMLEIMKTREYKVYQE